MKKQKDNEPIARVPLLFFSSLPPWPQAPNRVFSPCSAKEPLLSGCCNIVFLDIDNIIWLAYKQQTSSAFNVALQRRHLHRERPKRMFMNDRAFPSELSGTNHPATNPDRAGLLHSPLLQNLPKDVQSQLLRIGVTRSLRKGEHLFRDGQDIRGFHYVLAGRVKEYYPAEDGGECLRRIVMPGQYVSLHLILTDENEHTCSGESIGASRCFSWPFDAFREIMRREPLVALQVTRILADHVELSCRHTCLCRKTRALSKVAGFLLSKHRQVSQYPQDGRGCNGPVIQTDLRPLELTAAEICLARETFSRVLSCLQERGLIRVKSGVVELLDIEGLKGVSNDAL